MPRMGTYTQADADADIAVHAALTTAIHGVGALHVAGFALAGQALSKVVWRDASSTLLSDLNRTAFLDYTEKDLTAKTSERAKFVILRLELKADVVGSGHDSFVDVRKHGTTPAHRLTLVQDVAGTTAATSHYMVIIVGLSSDRKIDYRITPGTNWTIDTYLRVLGWIE